MSTVPRLRDPGLDALLFRTGVPLTQPCIPGIEHTEGPQSVLVEMQVAHGKRAEGWARLPHPT